MAQVKISGNIKNNAAYSNLDYYYGVYENWDAAELAFKDTPRRTGAGFFKLGFTVGIKNAAGKVEEWVLVTEPTSGHLLRNHFERKILSTEVSNTGTAEANVDKYIKVEKKDGTIDEVKISKDLDTYFIDSEVNDPAVFADVAPKNIKIKNKDASKNVELNILGYDVNGSGSTPTGLNADTLGGETAADFNAKINAEKVRAENKEAELRTDVTNLFANKLDATKCTFQNTLPTAEITDGGVHIVFTATDPAVKYSGYIYLIQE